MARLDSFLFRIVLLFFAPVSYLHAQFEGAFVRFEVPSLQLRSCAFSPDGSFFVVGGDSIRIYDWDSKRLIQQLRTVSRPRLTGMVSIPFSAYEKYLKVNGFPRFTQQVAFSPVQRSLFASADADGAIRIWRISDVAPSLVIPSDYQHISDLRFSPDGRLLVCLNDRYNKRGKVLGELRVWDAHDGSIQREELFYNDHAAAICFTPDGGELAVSRKSNDGDRNSRIDFYKIDTWQVTRSIELTNGGGSSILLLPNLGKMVVTGGECIPMGKGCIPTGRIWLADLDTTRPVQPLADLEGGYFNFAEATEDGQHFLVRTNMRHGIGGLIDQLQLRECNTGKLLSTTDCDIDAFQGMAIHPRGDQVAMLGLKTIFIVDPKGPQPISTLTPDPNR